MKKRVLSLMLAVVMVLTACPAFGASAEGVQKTFLDVYRDNGMAGYIYALANAGIVNGTDKNHFSPNKSITRAEFVTLLANAAAAPEELAAAESHEQTFTDVTPHKDWFAKFVYWAVDKGIAHGTSATTFRPNGKVKRSEVATFIYNFAQAFPEKADLTQKKEPVAFTDAASIPAWAKEPIETCQLAGVISGNTDGSFRPGNNSTRAQAATMLCKLLAGIDPVPAEQIPVRPKPAFEEPVDISGGIEFNPAGYTAKVVIANNKLFTHQSTGDMIRNSNSYIAVNGAFFERGTNDATNGTLVNNGEVIKIFGAPDTILQPHFIIDSQGRASIKMLKCSYQISITKDGKTYSLDKVGCNNDVGDNDGAVMVYTSKFNKPTRKFAMGILVNGNGKVTATYPKGGNNVSIPQGSYLLFERQDFAWKRTFFDKVEVGDTITRTFVCKDAGGNDVDVVTALSCGPTLVRNGKAYANYAAEGYKDPHVTAEANSKMAIGVKANGKVVIINYEGTLKGLSQKMVSLGCVDAMNLDGGASCTLCVKGKTRYAAESLTNMLIFSKKAG